MSKYDRTEPSPVLTVQMEDEDIDLTIKITAGVSVVHDAIEAMETVLRGFGYIEKTESLRLLTEKEFSSIALKRAELILDEPLPFPPLDKDGE